jgi:hypothetical protein
MQRFNDNWDGINRKTLTNLNEATKKGSVAEVKRIEKEMYAIMQKMNDLLKTMASAGDIEKNQPKFDAFDAKLTKLGNDLQKARKAAGMSEEAQPVTEETSMTHFTELDKAAKDLIGISKRLKGKKNIGGFTDEQAEVIMVANALIREHRRMKDFFDGLIYHIEGVHKKAMSPSKQGNTEILQDLAQIIRELKKYKGK